MINNLFKIAYRNLWKNKLFSMINILGLALAIFSSLVIFQYTYFELTYDRFHENASSIYRVQTDYIRNGEKVFDSAENFAGVGIALKTEIPMVEDYARLYNAGKKYTCTFSYKDGKFTEEDFYYADASFLSMFSFPLIEGNAATALSNPNTAVITESAAKKYFGEERPIGKTIKMIDNSNRVDQCTITGVVKDIPSNSHLSFDILFSYSTLYNRNGGRPRFEDSWNGRDNFYTYIKLSPNAKAEELSPLFPKIIDKYKPSYNEVDENGQRVRSNNFTITQIADIHLKSSKDDEPKFSGDANTVYFLAFTGIFILLIAWMNYINLAISKALERTREVGIRKFLGSSRIALVSQFLLESMIINTVATIVAFTFFKLSVPSIAAMVDWNIAKAITSDSGLIFLLLIIILAGGTLSGLYPALVLAGFNPWNSLSSDKFYFSRGESLKKSLVIFQFCVSFILIIGTLTVYKQVQFMKSKELGFNPDQLLVVKNPLLSDNGRYRRFKDEVLGQSSIFQIASSSNIPGKHLESGIVFTRQPIADLDGARSITIIDTDASLIDTYELNLKRGSNFGQNQDSTSVIINESAAKFLDFESPEDAVGQPIYLYGSVERLVIGVVGDYHHQSAQFDFKPIVFTNYLGAKDYFTLRMSSGNMQSTLAGIKDIWTETYSEYPFEYFFLDDFFNYQYKQDQEFNAIFSYFSMLGITISALGLFGFSLFRVTQRTREIGIRKILGAPALSIFFMLSKEFLLLIMMAIIFAIPISYWLIFNWLSNYAFRIELTVVHFTVPIIILVVVALASVFIQSLKVALGNPIESLKYD